MKWRWGLLVIGATSAQNIEDLLKDDSQPSRYSTDRDRHNDDYYARDGRGSIGSNYPIQPQGSIGKQLGHNSDHIPHQSGHISNHDKDLYGNYAKFKHDIPADVQHPPKPKPGADVKMPPMPKNMPKGGIGGMLGAITGAMGGKTTEDQKPDMFGRKPKPFSLSHMFGGGPHKKPHKGAPPPKESPVVDALLASVEAKMPINMKRAEKQGKAPISQESHEIVEGIITEFMNRYSLAPGEKRCLDDNIATLAADVVGTVEDMVKGIKTIIHAKKTTGSVNLQGQEQGQLVSAGLDGSMKLTSLVTMSTSLLKNCVKGDALEMLKKTGRHFINMKYIGHRLLVSGVDIARHLSDAIIAYEAKDWNKLGRDIGVALRKIFMSHTESGSRLPEGVPEEVIIEKTFAGLMNGFFVRNSGVIITDSAVPDLDIKIDLHRCIAGNHEFFKEAWLALWNLISQLSTNENIKMGKVHSINDLLNSGKGHGQQPKWMGELMVAMMQIPTAIGRCNIGEESQEAMADAMRSLEYLQVHFLSPEHKITSDEATRRMAVAIQAWTNWDFEGFGRQIGILLREFVLLMYPAGNSKYAQQYIIDETGRLRRQVNMKHIENNSFRIGGTTISSSPVFFSIGCMASMMLLALVAARVIKASGHNQETSQSDCEGPSDGELGTNFLEVE